MSTLARYDASNPAGPRKIYIVCDAFSQTGGPEALHQLGRALTDLGHDAVMVYVPRDLKPTVSDGVINFPELIQPMPSIYARYDLPHAYRIEDQAGVAVVLPEIWPSLIEYLNRALPYFWWLSVDNAKKLVDSFGGIEVLRRSRAIHLCQSYYALRYLADNGIHGIPLFDYTSPDHMSPVEGPIESRTDRILYPTKGRWFTEHLRRWAPRLNWLEISGFTPVQVGQLFRTSRLYIDFGAHPGKDRMPREAAILGCCVLTGKRGAAANPFDIPIPDRYKFKDTRLLIPHIIRAIRAVVTEYDVRTEDFDVYRAIIRGERREFILQAMRIFGGRLELPPVSEIGP
jgi:hypothetical protein